MELVSVLALRHHCLSECIAAYVAGLSVSFALDG